MSLPLRRAGLILFVFAAIVPLQAATVSRQTADVFAKKVAQIQQQGTAEQAAATRRTPVTQDEVNSWFTYRAEPVLPVGVSQPQLTLVGQGKVAGTATVDLDAIGKRRSTGGTFDPFSYLGGRVPISVEGILHTQDGRGRFEVQSAEISGVPVPTAILQELVSYYSKTPANPDGVSLDQAFALPANIRQIEVGPGQAVIVQ